MSILKEDPASTPEQVKAVEDKIEDLGKNLGEPSEMALIRRLHWWTVEYGLIGTVENPKIYGAGLLSSIGESVGCMKDDVKKLPYSAEAMNVDFDITKPRPQLFVTPNFEYLSTVLEQFADTMALRRGGNYGLTAGQRQPLGVYGRVFVRLGGNRRTGGLRDRCGGRVAYLWFTGPASLSDNRHQLPDHGTDYHKEGYSSPCGKIVGASKPLEEMSDGDLADINVQTNREATLRFTSGVTVKGYLESSLRHMDGKLMLLSFSGCTVTWNGRILFRRVGYFRHGGGCGDSVRIRRRA